VTGEFGDGNCAEFGGDAQNHVDAEAGGRRGGGGGDGAVKGGGAVFMGLEGKLETGGERLALEVVPAIGDELRATAQVDFGGQPEPEAVADAGEGGGGSVGGPGRLEIAAEEGRLAVEAEKMALGAVVEEFEESQIRPAGGVLPDAQEQPVRRGGQAESGRDAIPGDAGVLDQEAVELVRSPEVWRAGLREGAGQREREDAEKEAEPHGLIVPQCGADY